MSDIEDFMVDEEEDYGLVRAWALAMQYDLDLRIGHININWVCIAWLIVVSYCHSLGILRRQQLRAGCWFGKSVLQLESLEGRWSKGGSSVVSACPGSRKQWKGRVGIQGTKANDKNQLQTGMQYTKKLSIAKVLFGSEGVITIACNFDILKGNYQEMMSRYKQLLTYIKTAVTRNHSEKSINSILDYISTSKNVSYGYSLIQMSIFLMSDCSYVNFVLHFLF